MFFFSVWNRVVLLYFFGLMERLINDGVVWYYCLKCMVLEKIGIMLWELVGMWLVIFFSSE